MKHRFFLSLALRLRKGNSHETQLFLSLTLFARTQSSPFHFISDRTLLPPRTPFPIRCGVTHTHTVSSSFAPLHFLLVFTVSGFSDLLCFLLFKPSISYFIFFFQLALAQHNHLHILSFDSRALVLSSVGAHCLNIYVKLLCCCGRCFGSCEEDSEMKITSLC